ncbi:MAG: ABC transporter substrate-binding protein [Propionibacteriaceae bacterium]|jgi:iron complex transport system substrate-binding protein|nr:ABC transporter substrate-binding protein [Propionibacteriaceae bacterium]
MRRFTAILSTALLMLTTFTACSSDTPTNPTSVTTTDTSITVTDQMGRSVTLSEPADSIVGLTASDIEIIYALGSGSAVVGRGEYCNYPEEVSSVPVVQSGNETNIEQIIALKPDIVFVDTMAQTPEQTTKLEAAGIAVFVTDADTIAETYDSITLIGKVLGKDTEATTIVSQMKAQFATLEVNAQAAVRENGGVRKSVYFEVSPLEYGLWAAGSETFMDEVAKLLALDNIFSDVQGWAAVSAEQVLERKPDVILTVGMYFGEGPTPIESILQRAGWESVPAVANQAIINLTADELSRPGPRLALGAQELFNFVYGS